MQFISHNPIETQEIAWSAIEKEAQKFRGRSLCVGLVGELGAGKTTLVQGIGKRLGIIRPMPSPTFLLMREFDLPGPWNGIQKIYHFDWYRARRAKDIQTLGWDDVLADRGNLVLVEWADKFLNILPKGSLIVQIDYKKKERVINVYNNIL